mmetsp:Transcript_10232/g.16762  ORF Transcript_10232/g.16762 Transcript_10232/m.16762 type:complete len:466 (-) Transcript_10232:257-1654(-)|eukprot:CAMPEP_0184656488 /NCGR_PEP_ID=MMETSP0308-20130426/16540_1 /TAXON_ID=38269 /ORGANISM="Gloeochaete witrockiana, Strain SAG 46.84" /LENGTH=465 /DNA_ID=CAMNT_0027093641 /DNA_START=31 /DNA_END=1428 /DNA_ORIENTATION=-
MASDLHLAILEYLRDLVEDPTEAVDNESIEVAVQCLSETFGIDVSNPALSSGGSYDLLAIFTAGKKALAGSGASGDVESTDAYKKFMENLKAKGFFQGLTEGTPAFEDRYRTAKNKYMERFGDKSASSPKGPVPHDVVLREAEDLKNKGNAKVTAGEYAEAINLYTKAISLYPDSAVYYANRAAAYSHKGDHELAVQDCEKSISIDSKYSKAYSRLGTAYFHLGKYKEAITLGYAKALTLDPANAATVKALLEAQAKLVSSAAGDASSRAAAAAGSNMNWSSLGDMFNSPAMANMAQQLMSTPGLQQMAQSFMSGGAGPGAGGGAAGGTGAAAPAPANPYLDQMKSIAQTIESSPEMQKVKEDPKMKSVIDDIRQNGPMSIFKYMQDPEVMENMTRLAGPLLGNLGGMAGGIPGMSMPTGARPGVGGAVPTSPTTTTPSSQAPTRPPTDDSSDKNSSQSGLYQVD